MSEALHIHGSGKKIMGNLSKWQMALGVLFLVLVWGSAWPIYKIALSYSPPLLFAGMRSVAGGILFSLVLLPLHRQLRWKHAWRMYAVSAWFNVIIFLGVQSIGLQFLPAGLYSVIVYLQPVLVVLMAWIWLKESLTPMKIIGILIGFSGVVFVSLEGITGKISMLGIVLALITGIGWAIGALYVKKTAGLAHGLWMVAVQNILGGSVMLLGGLFAENIAAVEWTTPFIACLLFGSAAGVTAAPAVYFHLIRSDEAGRVSSFTFLVPLTSVLIGTIFLHEPFTLSLFIGMSFILLSIYLMNRKASSRIAAAKK